MPKTPKLTRQGSNLSSSAGSATLSSHETNKINSKKMIKVTILGAAGGIGQPLAMLLMMHPEQIQHIALYDLVDSIPGVALDVSHIDRRCKVTGYCGPDQLADAVRGAKVIIIPAGLAQKPGMSRDDLFGSNAKIILNLAKTCAQVAPDAMLAIISNPVNSLVPLVCEVYSRIVGGNQPMPPSNKNGIARDPKSVGSVGETLRHYKSASAPFDECCRRIFGVTTLDTVRASSLTAKSSFFAGKQHHATGIHEDPAKITIPVVGGHAGKTIMPLLSQATPKLDAKKLQDDKIATATLIDSIQQAGVEVLNAKRGKGSATLAMAYAAHRFTLSLLRALNGESNVIECAYVRHKTPVFADLEYFATPLILGKDGYTKSLGVGKVLPFEQQMLEEGAKDLRLSIVKGEDFAREQLLLEKPAAGASK